MLSNLLLQALQQRFPGRGLRVGTPPAPVSVFPAMHPEVGNIEIYDDGDELTLVAGRFTHSHFSNYEQGLSEERKIQDIVEQIVTFLAALFADEIILWGSHEGSGGWYRRGEQSPSAAGEQQFVWSGPLT